MPTPFEDLYTALGVMLAAVSTASPTTLTAAPTNLGLDFRITPGAGVWQLRSVPLQDYARATVKYPRAAVTVLLHHYVTTLTNERDFTSETLSHAADSLLDRATWIAQAGIYGLEPDDEPQIGDGERTGNVITFDITATVLMDSV